jgi:hypothetical protein
MAGPYSRLMDNVGRSTSATLKPFVRLQNGTDWAELTGLFFNAAAGLRIRAHVRRGGGEGEGSDGECDEVESATSKSLPIRISG